MDKDPRRTALRSGLEALSLLADEALLDRLLAYLDLLQKWNQAYNLSAVRDPQQMVHQHLLDCLAALPAVDRHLRGREARILDVGSGAGLPGVVWALMRPNWAVCCVDAVAKKASFVRQVAAELALRNLQAEHARVEQLCIVAVDVVVSRAFASLADFTALTRQHLAPGGCWLAMKGRLPEEEIAALPADVAVFHVEPLQVPGLDARRCLVWMRPH
ncbi:MAG: 16S rRNA (guanine(527)-N(7))-methyltransferase RsmG [Burkholderiaceae bacterium]|jgi:16S rRNA (guanine527-N7)-methyltransferase|nr:16S rRNA (guanine(527)-N(7))-methyltransferase RsmG [Burkholderiaceae bacterium]